MFVANQKSSVDRNPNLNEMPTKKKGSSIYTAVLPTKYWRFEYIVSRCLIRHAQKIESYVYTSPKSITLKIQINPKTLDFHPYLVCFGSILL